MGSNSDPSDDLTPAEKARRRLERAREQRLPTADEDTLDGDPQERAMRRLERARERRLPTADEDTLEGDPQERAMQRLKRARQERTGQADEAAPEDEDPLPSQFDISGPGSFGAEEDVGTLGTLLVTEGERGFRMFQQQTAAEEAIEIQDQEYSGTQVSAIGGTAGLPGTEITEERRQKVTERAAKQITEAEKRLQEIDQTEAMKGLSQAIQSGEGGQFWGQVWENPETAVGLAVQSSAMQPDALIMSGLASMLSPGAAVAAGSMGAQAVESRAAITQTLRDRGVDLTNAEEVMQALDDPSVRAEARELGEERGATIAGVDLATNLITGGLGRTALRPMAKSVLGFGLQTGGEAASEAAAQQVAGQETNIAEVGAEALGAAPLSAIETVGIAVQGEDAETRARRQTQRVLSNLEQTTTESAEGQQSTVLEQMDTSTLQTAIEQAREQGRQEDVQRLEQELNRREQTDETETDEDTGAGAGARQDGSGRRDERGEGPRRDPRREERPGNPEQQAREALQRARERRTEQEVEESSQPDRREEDPRGKLGVEDLPEDPAPEVGQREEEAGQEGQQGELEENMGARSKTRPEEQVEEAVQQKQTELEQAESERDQAEADFKDQVADVESERLQQLRQDVEDEKALELIRRVLESRRTTQTAEELRPQQQEEDPTEVQKPDLFPNEGDKVMRALKQAARRFGQRQRGVEAKRQELRQLAPQEEEMKQRARDAQGDLEDQDDQEAPQEPEPTPQDDEDADTGEAGGAAGETTTEPDDRDDAEPAGEDTDRQPAEGEPGGPVGEDAGAGRAAPPPGEASVRVREPVPTVERETEQVAESDDADTEGAAEEADVGTGREGAARSVATGTVTVTTTAPDGQTSTVEAELTDDALTVESVDNERQAKELAEVAARRDVPLQTTADTDLDTAEAMQRLANQGWEVRRAADIDRMGGRWASPAGNPTFVANAPQIDRSQPTYRTEEGYEVGVADRNVTRRTTRQERPDGPLTDRPIDELETELQEAVDRGDEAYAARVREALDTIRQQGRQTTYSHTEGDVVVRNPQGKLVDRRSPRYDDLVAEYMAENEAVLRDGAVEPRDADRDPLGIDAALRSSSPLQVLETYVLALRREGDLSNMGDMVDDVAQAIENIGRLDTDSFRNRAGDALVGENGVLRMNWLSSDGIALDAAAQQISNKTGQDVDPQDIIDYVEANPTRTDTTDAQQLAERFEELTGIGLTEDFAEQVKSEIRPDPAPGPDDVPDEDAPFQTIEEEGPATAAELVEAIVRRIADDMQIPAGNLTVAARPDDLPAPLAAFYERAQRSAGDGQVRPAFYMDTEDGGQVYLIASAIEKAARASQVSTELFTQSSLMHEVTGHLGMRGLLGDDFVPMMDALALAIGRDRLINARTQTGTRLIDANADKLEVNDDGQLTDASLRLLADEYLANVAEGMVLEGETQRTLFTTMKEWFQRSLGLSPSDSQIELLLNASRDRLRANQKEIDITGSTFDRRPAGRNSTRWMVLGSSASDFGEAQNEPTLFPDQDVSVNGVFRGPYDDALRFEIDDSDAAFNPDGHIKRIADMVHAREKAQGVQWEIDSKLQRARERTLSDEDTEGVGGISEDEYNRLLDDYEAARRRFLSQQSGLEKVIEAMKNGVDLEQVIDHDVLFEQYPDMRTGIQVRMVDFNSKSKKGGYVRDRQEIRLNTSLVDDIESAIDQQLMDADVTGVGPSTVEEALSEWMKVLIHEMQHHIQYEEGFAIGGNPAQQAEYVARQLKTARKAKRDYDALELALEGVTLLEEAPFDAASAGTNQVVSYLRNEEGVPFDDAYVMEAEGRALRFSEDAIREDMEDLQQKINDRGFELGDDVLEGPWQDTRDFRQEEGQRRYWYHAGEIEARRTQERRNMGVEGRQDEPFYDEELTEDLFPEEEVVVRFQTERGSPNQLDLFQGAGTEETLNLVSVHNLDERDVDFAIEQMDGHIPVPSVAVTKYKQGFDRFGRISLLGTPDLVDPGEGVPVFDADVWSPTSPSTQRSHDEEGVTDFFRDAVEYAKAIDDRSSLSALDHKARQLDDHEWIKVHLRQEPWAKMMYLDEVHDRQIEVPRMQPTPSYSDLLKYDPLMQAVAELDQRDDVETRRNARALVNRNRDTFEEDVHRRLKEAIREAARRLSMSKFGEHNTELIEAVTGGLLDGEYLDPNGVGTLLESYRTLQSDQDEVNTTELKERVDAAIEEEADTETVDAAMTPWAEDKVDQMFGPEYIENEAGQQLPQTLENIVDVMTEQSAQTGSMGMVASLKNARAAGANAFRSLGEMQSQRDRVVSEAKMEQAKEQLQNDWDRLRQQLAEHLTSAVSGFRRYEQPAKALADMYNRRLSADQARKSLDVHGYNVDEMSGDLVTAFVEFGERLLQAPTQYFEAKPQRAVALDEFEAAIVPDSASDALINKLADAVGRVETYPENDLAERQQLFEQVASERDLRFQTINEEQMGARFMTANDGPASMGLNENLVAMHNLDVDGLRWALDTMDGHIPAPSVAVTQAVTQPRYAVYEAGFLRYANREASSKQEALDLYAQQQGEDSFEDFVDNFMGESRDRYEVRKEAGDTVGMTKFGDVTLLAPPPMVDPAEEPVFAADAYTPRTPQVETSITGEAYDDIMDQINEIQDRPAVMQDLLIGDALTQERIDAIYSGEDAPATPTPNQVSAVLDRALDSDRKTLNKAIQRGRSVDRENVWPYLLYADDQNLDLGDMLEKTVIQAFAGQDFMSSTFRRDLVEELNSRLEGDPASEAREAFEERREEQTQFVHPRTREFTEATPENIVEAMVARPKLRAEEQESGTGATRAMAAERFESFEEMQAARDRVVSRNEMNDTYQEATRKVGAVADEMEAFLSPTDLLSNPKHAAENYIQTLAQEDTDVESMSVEQATDLLVEENMTTDFAELVDLRRRADKLDESIVEEERSLNEQMRSVLEAAGTAEYRIDGADVQTDRLGSFQIELLRELALAPVLESGTDLQETIQDTTQELQNDLVFDFDLNPILEGNMDPRNVDQEQALKLYQMLDATTPRVDMVPEQDSPLQQEYFQYLEQARDFRGKRTINDDASKAQSRLNQLEAIAEQGIESAKWLKTADTQYFEAKPARAVPLSEFRVAIVPEERTSEDLIQQLEEQGLEVRTYGTRTEQAELQADYEELRFQTTGFFAQDEADTPIERPDQLRTLQDYWDWVRSHMRRLFTNRGDLPESVFDANIQKQGWLKSTIQRVKWAVEDFQAALDEEYGGDLTEAETQRINDALGNGYRRHDVEQSALFEDDPEIESAVPATELFFAEIPLRPEAVRQDMTYIEDLPERVQEQVSELRDMVDEMSRAGIKTGLFSGQLRVTVEQNMGTYLTRSYRIHDEAEYGDVLRRFAREQADEYGIEMDPSEVPDNVPAEAWNRAVGWFRQNAPHMSEEQIQGRLLQMLRVDEDTSGTFMNEQLGQIPGEIYTRRKEIPEALRSLLGQYNDPATNFQRSMVKMAHGVANQTFLNEVKKKGLNRFLFKDPQVRNGTEYTAQIGEDVGEAMAPLSGLYTTPEIAQAFRTFNTSPEMANWQEWLMKAAVTLKIGKTVGSVRTQFRNYYGNIMFALSQGHLFNTRVGAGAVAGGAAGTAIGGPVGTVAGAGIGVIGGLATTEPKQEAFSFALRSLAGNFESEEARAEWQRMLQLGVVGDAVRAGELQQLIEDLDVDLDNPDVGLGDLVDYIVSKGLATAEKAYQVGDEVWKVYAYKMEKKRYREAKPNWSEKEVEEKAASVVRNTYPTYSLVPEFVKKLRRLPFNAPFVSFFSEVFRTTYHSLRIAKEDLGDPDTRHLGMQRAVGMLMAQGAMKALYEVSKYLTGFDDDDDEALRRLLPSWSQFSNIFHLPAKDGEAAYIDLGYLNPYKGYSEAVVAMMQGDDIDPSRAAFNAMGRLLNPFISEEILTRKLREAINNRSAETGNPIANPALQEVNAREFWQQRVMHVLTGFEPGAGTSLRRIINSMTEKGLPSNLDTEQEIISVVSGQRIRTVDAAEALKWETIGLEERYRNASRIFTEVLYKEGQLTESEVRSRYRQMLEAKREIIDHAHKDIQAVMNFGLSPGEAWAVLRSNRVGTDRALMMFAGQHVPQPDANLLVSRIEAARSEGRTEDAQVFNRRRKLALKVIEEEFQRFRERHPSIDSKFEETRRLLKQNNSPQ